MRLAPLRERLTSMHYPDSVYAGLAKDTKALIASIAERIPQEANFETIELDYVRVLLTQVRTPSGYTGRKLRLTVEKGGPLVEATGEWVEEAETGRLDFDVTSPGRLVQLRGYALREGDKREVEANIQWNMEQPHVQLAGVVRYNGRWSFDLKGQGDPTKVATLIGPDNQPQPVTAAPELLNLEGQRVIFLGTGRLMDISDFGNSKVQSIYAISDGATMVNARNSLVKQTYDRATDSMSDNAVDWTAKRGWYVDLPAGEQINTRPTIAYGGLAFVSNINGGADCSASSYLYVVNAKSGTKFVGTTFVSTLVSKTSNSSGVTALLTTGQKIVGAGQDADGKPWEREITAGTPILPGKNAWIEIRR